MRRLPPDGAAVIASGCYEWRDEELPVRRDWVASVRGQVVDRSLLLRGAVSVRLRGGDEVHCHRDQLELADDSPTLRVEP